MRNSVWHCRNPILLLDGKPAYFYGEAVFQYVCNIFRCSHAGSQTVVWPDARTS